jgi:hypothetical protein
MITFNFGSLGHEFKIFTFSYATRKSPSYTDFDQLSSMMTSRSPTPENSGQVTYITSFGDEEPIQIDKSKISSKLVLNLVLKTIRLTVFYLKYVVIRIIDCV